MRRLLGDPDRLIGIFHLVDITENFLPRLFKGPAVGRVADAAPGHDERIADRTVAEGRGKDRHPGAGRLDEERIARLAVLPQILSEEEEEFARGILVTLVQRLDKMLDLPVNPALLMFLDQNVVEAIDPFGQ